MANMFMPPGEPVMPSPLQRKAPPKKKASQKLKLNKPMAPPDLSLAGEQYENPQE